MVYRWFKLNTLPDDEEIEPDFLILRKREVIAGRHRRQRTLPTLRPIPAVRIKELVLLRHLIAQKQGL